MSLGSLDLSQVDSFFIRPATAMDFLNIRSLKKSIYKETLSQFSDTEPNDHDIRHAIAVACHEEESDMFLVAVQTSDKISIDSYNSTGKPKGPRSGYGATWHWVRGKEQVDPACPLEHSHEAISNGPVLGTIELRPFTNDRTHYSTAAQVILTMPLSNDMINNSLHSSVAEALIQQVAKRISSRNNSYTSLISEFPFLDNNTAAEERLASWLRSDYSVIGRLRAVNVRDNIPLDAMICQKMLAR